MGGIGKTTLAKEYFNSTTGDYVHRYWISFHSSIAESFIQTFNQSDGFQFEGNSEEIFVQICKVLENFQGRNLLVLDNFNNLDEFIVLGQLLPGFDLLVTSRLTPPGSEDFETLKIGALEEKSCRELFYTHYTLSSDDPSLNCLLRLIDYHTLTTELLAKTAQCGEFTIEELLSIWKKEEIVAKKLRLEIYTPYNQGLTQEKRLHQILLTAFRLANIENNNGQIWVLRQFSVLPPLMHISFEILSYLLGCGEGEQKINLKNSLNDLVSKGWIEKIITKKDSDINSSVEVYYEVHPIVQSIIREYLSPTYEAHESLVMALNHLLASDLSTKNPADVFPWVPIGESLISNITNIPFDWKSSLQNNLALVYIEMGLYDNAREVLENLLAYSQDTLGDDHEGVTNWQANLASVHRALGNYQQAKVLLEAALANDLKKYPKESQRILIKQSNLANINRLLGNYNEAKDLLKEVLAYHLNSYGDSHIETALTQCNLGVVYRHLGEYNKALSLLNVSLATYLSYFNSEHPTVNLIKSNLANTYRDLGNYKEARPLLEDALEQNIALLGNNHADVSIQKSDLATIYIKLGEYTKAESLLKEAITIDLKNFGNNHPEVAVKQSNLAHIYLYNEDYLEAKELLEEVLRSNTENFGEDNSETAIAKANLAQVYIELKNYDKSNKLLGNSYKTLVETLGSQHPTTQAVKTSLEVSNAESQENKVNIRTRRSKIQGDKVLGDKILGDKQVKNYYYSLPNSSDIPKDLTGLLPPTLDTTSVFGRKADLEKLSVTLENAKQVVIVNGLGGIGKSTLARLYIKEHEHNFDHIAWFAFADSDFKEVFTSKVLARNLRLNKQNLTSEEFLLLISQKIKELPGSNLLVIDNADNTEEISEYRNFLPVGLNNWKVLITSRGIIDGFEKIYIDTLSFDEAKQLFLAYFPDGAKEDMALNELLNLIGLHTLTIELMAKTLMKGRRLKTVKELLEKVKNKQYANSKLLKQIESDHRYRWKSDDEKRKIRGIYQYLLAVFDWAGLNEHETWLLKQFAVLPTEPIELTIFFEWLGISEEDNDDFGARVEEAFESLVDNGWLQVLIDQENGEVVLLHPILQSLIMFKLPPQLEDIKILLKGIDAYVRIDIISDDFIEKLRFIDTLKFILNVIDTETSNEGLDKVVVRAQLYDRLANLYNIGGDYNKALPYNELAVNLVIRFKEELTLDLTTQVVEERISFFENNLAITLSKLNRFEEAIPLFEKCIAYDLKNYGEDDTNLAAIRNNLAATYQELGENDKAKELLEKVIASNIKNYGRDHIILANGYNNLGWVYQLLGEFRLAVNYLNQALEISKTHLSENHPLIATISSNLGWVYSELAELKKAEKLLTKALDIDLGNYGESHPNIARDRANLGWVYRKLNRLDDAIFHTEKALEIDLMFFEENHSNIATDRNNLGDIYRLKGRYDESKELLEKALESDLVNFGKFHWVVARDYSNLGHLYKSLNKKKKAVEFYEKGLKITLSELGLEHPETSRDYFNLGFAYVEIKEVSKAKKCLKKSYEIAKKIHGKDHFITIQVKKAVDQLKFV